MKEYLKLKEQTTRETSKLQQKLDSIMRGQSTDVRARDRTTEKIASHRQRAEELDEDVRKQQSRLERLVEKDKEWKGDLERVGRVGVGMQRTPANMSNRLHFRPPKRPRQTARSLLPSGRPTKRRSARPTSGCWPSRRSCATPAPTATRAAAARPWTTPSTR